MFILFISYISYISYIMLYFNMFCNFMFNYFLVYHMGYSVPSNSCAFSTSI